MKYPRTANIEELGQLARYMMNRAICSEDDAQNMIENSLSIAVFDDYYDNYAYKGRIMVVIGDAFVSEVFVWDESGQLYSTDSSMQ